MDGGWHGEGRAAVLLTPRRMSASPVCALVSPFSWRGGPIEWRGVVCAVVPCLRIGSGTSHCSRFPLALFPLPSRIVPASLSCCPRSFSVCVLCVVVCGGVTVSRSALLCSSLLPLCSLLQHCWFSAVSLWQGCVIVE